MSDMTGKVAIVTGAGSVGPGWGNGKAIAAVLARRGAKVLLVDMNIEAAEQTKIQLTEEGFSGVPYQCNMLAATEVEQMVAYTVSELGRLDILVNNVGGSAPGSVQTMEEAVWDKQINLNLKTAFLGTKYALPEIIKSGGGSVINIGSIAAISNDGERQHIAYSASKAGLTQFTKATASSVAPKQVRCNIVTPGLMHTPLVEARLAHTVGGDDSEALIAKRNALCPMGRMGTAWDVANAVAFLASDEASYITGVEIVVDGGITLGPPSVSNE